MKRSIAGAVRKRHSEHGSRNTWESRIEDQLRERRNTHTYRSLPEHPDTPWRIDLTSNDYLGLQNHPKRQKAIRNAIRTYGIGATGPRLLSGNYPLIDTFETQLATALGMSSALTMTSGYQANLAALATLLTPQDLVIADKSIHASLLDGIRLSGSTLKRFRHNDTHHLETLLNTHRRQFETCLILTEGLFSMDGDTPPLPEIVALKHRYDCRLMIDEAHSIGLYGPTGMGIAESYGLTTEIDLITGGFGKAFGSSGGFIACSLQIKNYLLNTARPFIYSTAPSPLLTAANQASLSIILSEPQRRKQVHQKAKFLKKHLQKLGIHSPSESPILPIHLGDSPKTIAIANALRTVGIHTLAIRPPTTTVPQLRLSISATHRYIDLKAIPDAFQNALSLYQ